MTFFVVWWVWLRSSTLWCKIHSHVRIVSYFDFQDLGIHWPGHDVGEWIT